MSERIQLTIGVWILLSPWLLGFADISIAKWGNVVCGVILVLIGVWQLFGKVAEVPATSSEKKSQK